MKITHCQTNHLTDPLGYAIAQPVFTWQVEDAAGKDQTAARILVKKRPGRCGRHRLGRSGQPVRTGGDVPCAPHPLYLDRIGAHGCR